MCGQAAAETATATVAVMCGWRDGAAGGDGALRVREPADAGSAAAETATATVAVVRGGSAAALPAVTMDGRLRVLLAADLRLGRRRDGDGDGGVDGDDGAAPLAVTAVGVELRAASPPPTCVAAAETATATAAVVAAARRRRR